MPLVDLNTAAQKIRDGELVAFATETVYGLGGDATNDRAVASIYAQKGRPQFNPLIVHFADLEITKSYVVFTQTAEKVAAAFWPGPLTLILNRKSDCEISKLCSAGGETLAVRMPRHVSAIDLIKQSGKPIAAPSANSSGKISPTSPRHVMGDFGENFPVLNGGHCEVGLESTVLDLSEEDPRILRPGSITASMLSEILGINVPYGPKLQQETENSFKSPGLLTSHYAPDKPLRLNAQTPQGDEFFVGFGSGFPHVNINLSPTGDLIEAAANLFDALHAANVSKASKIAFSAIPDQGIGKAINDRLTRAAAPR